MAQIAAAPDDTIAAFAMRTSLDQSTLSRNLRALEGEGLVEITMVESDLRRRARKMIELLIIASQKRADNSCARAGWCGDPAGNEVAPTVLCV